MFHDLQAESVSIEVYGGTIYVEQMTQSLYF